MTMTLSGTAGVTYPDGSIVATAVGTVVQVVQTVKTDVFSTGSSSYVDVTGLSVSITPQSSSNKILVNVSLAGSFLGPSNNNDGVFQVLRGATAIGNSADGFSMTVAGQYKDVTHSKTFVYLDSPATTSATTYKVQAKWISSGTVFVNARGSDGNVVVTSTITVMEVKV